MPSPGGKLRILLFLLLSGSIWISCNRDPNRLIRIGYQPYWSGQANIVQAMKHLQLVEKHDCPVKYYQFLSGPEINQALASGSIDAGFGGDMPTVSALASGMGIRVLASVSKSLRQAVVVDAEKAGEITKPGDLVGKQVAVAKGSCAHYFLYRVLADNGINPREVQIIHIPVKAQPPSLIANTIDACVNWEPWPTRLEKLGLGKILVSGGFAGYLYARSDFLDQDPAAAQALVSALQEALEYTQTNFRRTCKWVQAETREDYAVVCRSAETDRIFQPGGNIKPEPGMITELEKMAGFLLANRFIPAPAKIRAGFDLSYVDRALPAAGPHSETGG